MTACSPIPQCLACSGQRGIPAVNWPKFMEIKESGAAVHCTNCALLRGIAHVLSSLFLLLTKKECGFNDLFFLLFL